MEKTTPILMSPIHHLNVQKHEHAKHKAISELTSHKSTNISGTKPPNKHMIDNLPGTIELFQNKKSV